MTLSGHTDSYYAASVNGAAEHPQLLGEERVDVCIVGAGFTGLSAALELAERGYEVCVVEAERVGWGASGRNGGQICSAYNRGQDVIAGMVGDDNARVIWDISEQAKDLIRQRVEKYDIDCDLTWGYLHCASKPSHMQGLEKTMAAWQAAGVTGLEMFDRDGLKDRLGTEIYHGAFRETGAGHLHPLNYVLGLGQAAASNGARIYERSRVTRVSTEGEPVVETEQGSVRAKYLILAGNAYLGNLAAPLFHRIMPVSSFIVATEPLGENRARGLIRDNEAVVNSLYIVDYYRLSADNRMLFGGRANYTGHQPRDLFADMGPRMLKVFPQLADARLDYAWGGILGITINRLPHVGRLGESTLFAHGYCGHGVAMSGMCGKLMAEAIAGTAERFDVMSRICHQPFPGGPIRTPMLALGMLYYRIRDLLS